MAKTIVVAALLIIFVNAFAKEAAKKESARIWTGNLFCELRSIDSNLNTNASITVSDDESGCRVYLSFGNEEQEQVVHAIRYRNVCNEFKDMLLEKWKQQYTVNCRE